MSNRYQFEITEVQQSGKIDWKITSRLGAVWTGSFEVAEATADDKISLDITFDQPNSPIPRKGQTLLQQRMRSIIMNSIRSMIKRIKDNPELAKEMREQFEAEMEKQQ